MKLRRVNGGWIFLVLFFVGMVLVVGGNFTRRHPYLARQLLIGAIVFLITLAIGSAGVFLYRKLTKKE